MNVKRNTDTLIEQTFPDYLSEKRCPDMNVKRNTDIRIEKTNP